MVKNVEKKPMHFISLLDMCKELKEPVGIDMTTHFYSKIFCLMALRQNSETMKLTRLANSELSTGAAPN